MKNKTNLILVVDDEVEIPRLLRQRFRKKIQAGDLSFQFASNGVEALKILRNSADIDMILTDIRMPEMNGLNLLASLAEFDYPLKAVVISAYGDMKNIRTAMNRGAFDFLTKPLDFEDLEITIDKTLAFVAHLRKQQQELQDALDRLHNLVFYDQLTELYNSNGLMKQITQSLEGQQARGREFALLMLEIERYAIVKSGFGHALSDRLLLEVAKRLKQGDNSDPIAARVGENVFAVFWPSLDTLEDIQERAQQLLRVLETPFQLDDLSISSTACMGIASSALPYSEAEAFFQAADTALQIAKQDRRKDLVAFETRMQEKVVHRFSLEVELQKAIEARELSLHYQPIFRLDTAQIMSFEALARWQHPERGWVSPFEFISLAEESGLIVPLGEWVISEACRQLGRWQTLLGAASSLEIGINLSSLQLQSPTLLSCIDASLEAAGLTGNILRLEITESVLMENIDAATELLDRLQERNIKLSIDDFGTGYSSLAYLQLLPINALKIDRSFIHDIETNSANYEIASAIINLAHHLKLEVVAEGLEKEDHLRILQSLSCQYGQGFLFSRPLDVTAATELIAKQYEVSEPLSQSRV
ncbi:MAG: putative bifunctional diguanylate cyclase/phosphodiesterase [Spirulina sp.]